jgi:hypothetical protein
MTNSTLADRDKTANRDTVVDANLRPSSRTLWAVISRSWPVSSSANRRCDPVGADLAAARRW